MMLTDMADALRAGGLNVVEHPGWKTKTQKDGPYTPRGLIFHHDASPVGPSPNLPAYLGDLSHPGSQLWVDYYGTWHCIAAGRMWHAGVGMGWGVIPLNAGNTYAIGVETDHTTGEAWPPKQLASIIKGFAALCKYYKWDPVKAVCGHKEFAKGRKVDPDPMDMNWFRNQVAMQLVITPAPVPTPAPNLNVGDNMIQLIDVPPGNGARRFLIPTGKASQLFEKVWFGAAVNGPTKGRLRLWCQSSTIGLGDTDGWREIPFNNGLSGIFTWPLPDGTVQMNVQWEFPEGGTFSIEALSKKT